MAKAIIVAIYDSATEAYMAPSTMQARGQALRAFTDMVNNPQSEVSKHPHDYALFELGQFDDNSGLITQPNTPVCLARGHEVQARSENHLHDQVAMFPVEDDGNEFNKREQA